MNIFERFRIARENYQKGYRASREMGRLERAKAGKEVKPKKTVKNTKLIIKELEDDPDTSRTSKKARN